MEEKLQYPILTQIGLNQTEAQVYETLLKNGPQTGSKIAELSGIGRGNVYNALQSLKSQNLVMEKQGTVAVFEAASPFNLQTVLDKELGKLDMIKTSFAGVLPLLSSEFSQTTGKPVIQIFTGLDGLEKALLETLDTTDEILTYLDVQALTPELKKINERYLKQRIKRGVSKKILADDTQYSQKFYIEQKDSFTEVKILPSFPSGYSTSLQIFSGRVLYLTLTEANQIAVLIRDQNIFKMHRAHFMYLWAQAASLASAAADSKTI